MSLLQARRWSKCYGKRFVKLWRFQWQWKSRMHSYDASILNEKFFSCWLFRRKRRHCLQCNLNWLKVKIFWVIRINLFRLKGSNSVSCGQHWKKKLKRTFIRRPADRDPAAEGQADSQSGERPQGQAAGGGWPPREDQEVGDDLSKRICWKRMILRLYFLLSSFEKRFPCRLEQEAGSYQRMIEVRHQFLDNQWRARATNRMLKLISQ